MKPLTLTIQGLNSFEESVCIDFCKLTSRGLFGIFGPTGSGKSSILDGMTLALYGEAARGTKNFINVNSQRCSVIFEFLAGPGGRERYRVSRNYRREKETGSARASLARLEKIGPEGQSEILADQTRNVNEECIRILGLGREDFLRTAVLPQGRFAEFLRMQGKERTEMLERIFGLERFGTLLEKRVRDFGQKTDQRIQILEGKRQVYQGVTKEALGEKERLLEEKKRQAQKTAEEIRRVQAYMEAWKPVLDAQAELSRAMERSRALKEAEPAVKEAQVQAERAETAEELSKLWESAGKARESWEKSSRERARLEAMRAEASENLEQAGKTRAEAQQRRDEEKPPLDRKLEKLELARERVKRLTELEGRRKERQREQEQTQEKLAALDVEMEALSRKREALIRDADVASKRKQETFHTQEEREAIQRGWELEIEEQTLLEEQRTGAEALARQEVSADALKKRETELALQLKEIRERLENGKQALEKCRKEQEALGDLAAMQEAFTKVQYAGKEWNRQKAAVKEAEELVQKIGGEMDEIRGKEQEALARMESAKKTCEDARRRLHAAALARDLKEGEPCPVCGSVHHRPLAFEESREQEELSRAEEAARSLEEAAQAVSRERIARETKLAEAKVRLSGARELEAQAAREAGEKDPKELERRLRERIRREKELSSQERTLRDEMEAAGEENTAISLSLTKTEAERKNLDQSIEEGKKRQQEARERLAVLSAGKEKLALSWPRASYQESRLALQRDARAFEEADQRLQKIQRQQTRFGQDWDALTARQAEGQKALERLRTELLALGEQAEQEKMTLRALTEDWTDLPGRIQRIQKGLAGLEERLDNAREAYAAAEKRFSKVSSDYDQAAVLESRDKGSLQAREGIFQQKMALHQVPDTDWIVKNRKTPEEIEELLNLAASHREQETVVRENIARLQDFLGERRISGEEWEKNTSGLPALLENQEALLKEISVLENETARLRAQLVELQSLDAGLEKERHQRALGTELEKLFRGKAFVKYISLYYLRFITRDANRQLRDITGGNYELAIGENGDFLMVDYRNGGKTRPCSTLSGGETFLVSLALALSLSRQIQMNSSASIELFFLDEGFGTLDDRFIDVVMDSLYRLREKGLNVGLITHVEAIKERIGSRLLIQPGEKGSSVSCEFL